MDDLNGWIVIKCLMNEFDVKHIAIVITLSSIRFDRNWIGVSDDSTVLWKYDSSKWVEPIFLKMKILAKNA